MPPFLASLIALDPYTLTLIATMAVGLGTLWYVSRAYGLDAGFALDAALMAALLGIVAGRVEVVVANLDYFRERPASALYDLRSGGIGQRSLVGVGVVGFLCIVAVRRRPWRQYATALAPAIGLASAVAWAGFAFAGLGAGIPVDAPLLVSLPDQYGIVARRLPLQFVMAGGHLLLAALTLLLLNRVTAPGVGLCIWGAATAALSSVLDSFRCEPVYLSAGVPRALVADAVLAVAWLIAAMAIVASRRAQVTPPGPVATASDQSAAVPPEPTTSPPSADAEDTGQDSSA